MQRCKTKKLLALSLLFSPPQGSFHDLLHREPMLRMQEGEGHSQLCLDRLQLEAIHKVQTLSLIFSTLLHSHYLPPLALRSVKWGMKR